MDRTPYDGKPYYCETCGLGFAELVACEEPGCRLEDDVTARFRATSPAAAISRAEQEGGR